MKMRSGTCSRWLLLTLLVYAGGIFAAGGQPPEPSEGFLSKIKVLLGLSRAAQRAGNVDEEQEANAQLVATLSQAPHGVQMPADVLDLMATLSPQNQKPSEVSWGDWAKSWFRTKSSDASTAAKAKSAQPKWWWPTWIGRESAKQVDPVPTRRGDPKFAPNQEAAAAAAPTPSRDVAVVGGSSVERKNVDIDVVEVLQQGAVKILKQDKVIKEHVDDKAVAPNDKITINKILQREQNNSAYHALNNALFFMVHGVTKDGQYKHYINFLNWAVGYLVKNKEDLVLENLDEKALSSLLQGVQQEYQEALSLLLQGVQQQYHVLPHFIILDNQQASGSFSVKTLEVVQTFLMDPRSTLCFLIPSSVAVSNPGFFIEQIHWVSCVAKHEGDKIKLYCMNSNKERKPFDFSKIEQLFCKSSAEIALLIHDLKNPEEVKRREEEKQKAENLTIMFQGVASFYKGWDEFRVYRSSMLKYDVFLGFVDCNKANSFYNFYDADLIQIFEKEKLRSVALEINRLWITESAANKLLKKDQLYLVYGKYKTKELSFIAVDKMDDKYKTSSLMVLDGKKKIVYISNLFLDMVRVCLNEWKDLGDWPTKIQELISRLLLNYIYTSAEEEYLFLVLDKGWQDFGGVGTAINQMLDKLPDIELKQKEELNAALQELLALLYPEAEPSSGGAAAAPPPAKK